MSLPKELGVMCPADSIIGFIKQSDSTASVKGYYLDVSARKSVGLRLQIIKMSHSRPLFKWIIAETPMHSPCQSSHMITPSFLTCTRPLL